MEFTKMEIIRKINGLKEQLKEIKKNGEESKMLPEGREMQIAYEKCELEHRLEKKEYKPFGLPSELMDVLFASLPFQNAFNLLGKVSNGLLARNVGKMLFSIKMAMFGNKWNVNGQSVVMSNDGLVLTYSGPNDGIKCIRADQSIPLFNLIGIKKRQIPFFFQVHILQGQPSIGICSDEFSIVIKSKMGIHIGGSLIQFENFEFGWFEEGDTIGLGLIHHPNFPIQCFAILNGRFLGKGELPSNIVNLRVFPSVHLFPGDKIRAEFNKKEELCKQITEEKEENDGKYNNY